MDGVFVNILSRVVCLIPCFLFSLHLLTIVPSRYPCCLYGTLILCVVFFFSLFLNHEYICLP